MKKFILGIAFLCITLISSLNAEIIIDVRTIDEYNSGHIENSLNIEWQAIDEINHSISKDEKIYLYCRSGNRSGFGKDILNENNFTAVNVDGGMLAWKADKNER